MKTNSILILILGFVMISLTSCFNNPDGCIGKDEKLMTINFESEINQIVPDVEAVTSLVFVNSTGEKIILDETDKQIYDHKINVEHLCGNGDSFSKNIYSYYHTDYESTSYSNISIDFTFAFQKIIAVENVGTAEEYIYDRLTIYANQQDTYYSGVTICMSVRGNVDVAPDEFEMDDYVFHESIDLDETTYQNVYSPVNHSGEKTVMLYLSLEEGIIGFIDKDEVFWKLKK